MLGRCPRSLLHRTTSKGELHTQSHEIVHLLPSSEDEKPLLQPPHQIVIGFDLGADSSQACESPRSVLDPHNLCFRSHHQALRSPRSPLSALGSLLSGNPRNGPCTEGAALCLKVAVKAEEAAVDANARHTFSSRGHVITSDGADPYCTLSKREHNMADHSNANMQCKAAAFSRMNYVGAMNHDRDHVWCGSRANPHSKTFLGSDCEVEDNDKAANDNADEDIIGNPVSIFSTASPVSKYFRCDSLAVDFLSKCFLCRRHLLQGKDIYMYRGDRAFCSPECRSKQIVVDERKERCPEAVTCVSGASTYHQRARRASQTAVA